MKETTKQGNERTPSRFDQASNRPPVSDLKLWVVWSRAHRAITDALRKDVQQHGLNITEFAVLELLYHKGDQPIQHIGKKILISSGTITYVVDKLVQKKLIRRHRCPNDRRVTYAQLTEDGEALIARIFPLHQKKIEEMFEVLDNGEKQVLIDLLKTVGYQQH